MDDERWLPVPNYEGFYEVSDHGAVKSLGRWMKHPKGRAWSKERVLRPIVHRSGHKSVVLCRDGHRKKFAIHTLVLLAFVGPCPPDHECCHGPTGAGDNRLSNLRWGTRSSNKLDQRRDGVDAQARKTHCPQRHEYTPENTYVTKDNRRMCRQCSRDRNRARRAAIAKIAE